MSIATVIMGQSGTGKSCSMRNLDPEKTILVQSIKKPLPFRSKEWKRWDNTTKTGSIACTDNPQHVIACINAAVNNGKEIVIIDDYQYVIANEFMRRASEKGFDKFAQMAVNMWSIANAAINADDKLRVYILTHTQTDDYGMNAKMKTIGKMLDEKITLEGMFSTVLKSVKSDDGYFFATQNDGTDTVKSPMGLFDSHLVENDLSVVDAALCDYYGIEQEDEKTKK